MFPRCRTRAGPFHLACAAVFCLLCALHAQGSVPKNQTLTFDSVVRVIGKIADGTGTLIDSKIGQESLSLCFLTADHVVKNNPLTDIGFLSEGEPKALRLPSKLFKKSKIFSGSDPKIKLDMAVIGVTFKNTDLPIDVYTYLIGVKGVGIGVAPKDLPKDGFNFKEIGFGLTGTPDTDFKDFPYVHHPLRESERYGTQRFYNNTVKLYGVQDSGTYKYDDLLWQLRAAGAGAIEKEGLSMPGDSGSPLLVDDKIVGIATAFPFYSTAKPLDPAGAKGIPFESINIGLRMTEDYKKQAVTWCKEYMASVPEANSALLFVLGLIGLVGCPGRMARRREHLASRECLVP